MVVPEPSMPSRTMKSGCGICVKRIPDLHGSGRGEKLVEPSTGLGRHRRLRWRRPAARAIGAARRRPTRRPPTSTCATCAAWSVPRGASGARAAARRRRWSTLTRCPRRSAIRRTRATASTSAPAWRPNARCRGGPCRAVCCRRSRSSGARSSGATPPTGRRRWFRAASPTRRAGASRGRRSASGSRERPSPRRCPARTAASTCGCEPGPWTYFVRVSRPTLATEIADLRIEKAGDDRAQLPSRARERDPRARRRQQGRADRRRDGPRGAQRRGSGGVGRGAERRRRHVRARRPRQPALLSARVEVRLAARDAEVDRCRAGQGNRLQARAHRRHRGPRGRHRRGRAGQRHRGRAALGRVRRDGVADHLAGRQRRQVRAGPLPDRNLLSVGPPRRDAGLSARED